MANIISGFRIVCGFSLIFCPAFSTIFYIVYIVGGISDVLDGWLARHSGSETELGAKLDTAADAVFVVVVLIKIICAVHFPIWLLIWIAAIAIIKCVSAVSGYVMHKRFLSEHTVMNKICGALLFIIPLCIDNFPRQSVTVLIIFTCAAATFAAFQEGYYTLNGKEIR